MNELSQREKHLIAAGRIYVQAAAAAQREQLPEAELLYRRVLEMVPGHALSLLSIGLIRAQRNDRGTAVAMLRQALDQAPDMVDARYNLAVLLQDARDPEAIACFEGVLAYVPDHLQALLGLGNAQADAGRDAEAMASFRRALRIDPEFAPALVNLGRLLAARGNAAEAFACCEKVLKIRPDSAEAHFNAGTALKALGRNMEAMDHLRTALRLDPRHARSLVNLGNILKDEEHFAAAATCYEHAIAAQPNYVDALNNLGHLRCEQGRGDDAVALYERALAIDAGNPHARIALCIAQLAIVYRDEAEINRRRQGYAGHLTALAAYARKVGAASLAAGVGAIQPFYLPYQGRNDRDLQALYGSLICEAMATRRWRPPIAELGSALAAQAAPAKKIPEGRIRIGFVSGFFRDHSNWKIPIKGWLSGLDRSRFDLFCYYTGKLQDTETATARSLCHRFVQGPLPIERWREIIMADRPDVLIYPEIGIDPTAVQLAAQRLAPVQCNSWGQPVTSGMPTMDYFLSSDLMEPPDAEDHYTETLVRLPGLSIHYDEHRVTTSRQMARARHGVRPNGIVFWCGQTLAKFQPQHDDVFPRIARQVGDCQFLFIRFRHGDGVTQLFQNRMEAAFAAHGLRAQDHCVMLPYMDQPDFVATYAASDIFLDSIGWSGCNTILESLSHDLPIVSMAGEFMRGRHGVAILHQLGVPELACETVTEYCATAARLANNAEFRETMRSRINAGKRRLYRDPAPAAALGDFLVEAVRAAG